MLDHRLVEFAAILPLRQRVRGGIGKWLMKQAMRRYLPEDILFRRKMGFATPVSAWFRDPLSERADHIIGSTALAETQWFDRQALRRIVDRHKSGREEHGRQIWQLLMPDRSLRRIFGRGHHSA